MIIIRTLSLFTYFTYIFIDIIICVLESKLWSSEIFRMMSRVVADLSLGLLSLYRVVPRVPMLIREKRGTSVKSCGAYAECYSRYRESEAAFEGQIVAAANLLVDNHFMTEHNSYMGLRHGRLNHLFELDGVLC
jgi:hypothetical protein